MDVVKAISEQILHRDLFDFNLKYLTFVGLWPENWNRDKLFLYKIYEINLHLLSIIFIVLTGIGTYQYRDDITIAMTNLDKCLAAYNFIFKIFFFVLKREKLKALISEIRSSSDKISDDRKMLMGIYVIVITLLATILVGSFSLVAQLNMEMTIEAWMPFNQYENRYSLLMAAQILAICFVVPCLFRAYAIQGIVCSIIMYFCDQLDELQDGLSNLDYSEETDRLVREELKNIIKKHVRIMGYGDFSIILSKILKRLSDSYRFVTDIPRNLQVFLKSSF